MNGISAETGATSATGALDPSTTPDMPRAATTTSADAAPPEAAVASSTITADESVVMAAIRRYEDRLARDPASLVFATLADLYRKAGRAPEAITLCREGLQRFPQYTTARLILAKALVAADRLDDALAELTAILAATPNDAQAHRLLADAHRSRGELDAAVRHLEVLARLDPADREARTTLALLKTAPPEQAEGGLARLLRDDTFVTPIFGRICLEQGLADEAASVFSRLVRRDAADQAARHGLEQALRAKSGRKRG